MSPRRLLIVLSLLHLVPSPVYLKDYYARAFFPPRSPSGPTCALTPSPWLSPPEYPTALVIGPEGLAEKFKDEPALKVAGEYTINGLAGPKEQFGFEDEIISCYCALRASPLVLPLLRWRLD